MTAPVRPLVAQSWRRSQSQGVDRDRIAATECGSAERLSARRANHPLSAAMPLVRRLLTEDAAESGAIVAVADADGTLLWVEGSPRACRRAERMNFAPGAGWSERGMGTNAPGTALAVGSAVGIRGDEHFAAGVRAWSCSAAPVRDGDGRILGALDVTGSARVASRRAVALVRATAVAVENHLALLRLTGAPRAAAPRLTVLGAGKPRWIGADARATALAGRHAEILLLLKSHPEGLSADALAMLLDDDLDAVTVRAEMCRLRNVIGPDLLESRPYRLSAAVTSDVDDVLLAIDDGDLGRAMEHYRGAVLPRSDAPGVERLRMQTSTSLRSAVLASDDLAAVGRWLRLPESRDDREVWAMLRDRSAPGSPAASLASGQLAGIDMEFGLPVRCNPRATSSSIQ